MKRRMPAFEVAAAVAVYVRGALALDGEPVGEVPVDARELFVAGVRAALFEFLRTLLNLNFSSRPSNLNMSTRPWKLLSAIHFT